MTAEPGQERWGQRHRAWVRSLLIFIAGILLGANGVYYLMTLDRAIDTSAPRAYPPVTDAPASSTRPPTPASPVGDAPPAPATPEMPATVAPPPGPRVVLGATPSGLIVPVSGIASNQLLDTFTDARGSDRVHDAIDIMAPRGTPVLAVADGEVEKLFTSEGGGGLTIYQFEPSGRYAYYYAHLDRYAADLKEGQALKQGDVIGYVGSTGNASPDAPHLHFAIFVLGADKRWWDGTAINPYPLLRQH